MNLHAAEELEDDGLSILDHESIIISCEIIWRQRDRSTRESKCVANGTTLGGDGACAVVKLGSTGRLYISLYITTVWLER